MAAWVSQAAIFIRFAKSFVNDLHFIWYFIGQREDSTLHMRFLNQALQFLYFFRITIRDIVLFFWVLFEIVQLFNRSTSSYFLQNEFPVTFS